MNSTIESHQAIGLMSGTSLDGLDIAHVRFNVPKDRTAPWSFALIQAETIPYPKHWLNTLETLPQASALELAKAHRQLGTWYGQQASQFIKSHGLAPQLVASHGHTLFHQPQEGLTVQIGHGQYLQQEVGFPVVCDFRTADVLLGGQGAPLVPIGDSLLFHQYSHCLNLGGIANVSFTLKGQRIAYDICPVNLVFNSLARKLGKAYDAQGKWAQQGSINHTLLKRLNALPYYQKPYPKSLGREWVEQHFWPLLETSGISTHDQLATASEHAALQIAETITLSKPGSTGKVLVTGGGAFNTYLIQRLQALLSPRFTVALPEPDIINYKEALIFALLGVLSHLRLPNALASVTGAQANSIGGTWHYPISN